MAASSSFPGFDGLITLSRREGVDIRPTLLRVLTDLYVQTSRHSEDEARQFVELTSRLIDQVDDATRAAVRARLAVYPDTPLEVLQKLGESYSKISGDFERFTYQLQSGGTLRIELEGGRVVSVQSIGGH